MNLLNMFRRRRLNTYVFRHRDGAKHTIKARDLSSARQQMKSFIVHRMYGYWALVYDEARVNEIMLEINVQFSESHCSCGGEFVLKQIPCPDCKPGCLVLHRDYRCEICNKSPKTGETL